MLRILVLLLGFGFRLSEAMDWKQPSYWSDLLPNVINSLGMRASIESELQKRAINKTIWISAKEYQGATFFEYVKHSYSQHGPVSCWGCLYLTILSVNGTFMMERIIHSENNPDFY